MYPPTPPRILELNPISQIRFFTAEPPHIIPTFKRIRLIRPSPIMQNLPNRRPIKATQVPTPPPPPLSPVAILLLRCDCQRPTTLLLKAAQKEKRAGLLTLYAARVLLLSAKPVVVDPRNFFVFTGALVTVRPIPPMVY